MRPTEANQPPQTWNVMQEYYWNFECRDYGCCGEGQRSRVANTINIETPSCGYLSASSSLWFTPKTLCDVAATKVCPWWTSLNPRALQIQMPREPVIKYVLKMSNLGENRRYYALPARVPTRVPTNATLPFDPWVKMLNPRETPWAPPASRGNVG